MKKSLRPIFLVFILIAIAFSGCVPVSTSDLPTLTPSLIPPTQTHTPSPSPTPTFFPERNDIRFSDLGILWRECELPLPQNHAEEECLGLTRTNWDDVDKVPFGKSFEPPNGTSGKRLLIGNNVYETVKLSYGRYNSDPADGKNEYRLYKNGEILLTRKVYFGAYDPNITLIDINGKYAWEFAENVRPTVIFDGVDISQELELDAAYRPFVIGEKLIFVAKKNEKMYVVIDGKQIGPTFDFIDFGGYCCEPSIFIERRPGQYWFWGRRGDKSYVVVVTEIL